MSAEVSGKTVERAAVEESAAVVCAEARQLALREQGWELLWLV